MTKKNPRVKGHCSLDIKTQLLADILLADILLADVLFDGEHVQIHFEFYLAEISLSFLKL